MGVRIGDVGFSVMKELCVEGSSTNRADGIVVPCFHLSDFVEVEMEFVKSDFLVHVGDVLDDGICLELLGGLIALYGLCVGGSCVLWLGNLVWLMEGRNWWCWSRWEG